jgi:hypothetical protein
VQHNLMERQMRHSRMQVLELQHRVQELELQCSTQVRAQQARMLEAAEMRVAQQLTQYRTQVSELQQQNKLGDSLAKQVSAKLLSAQKALQREHTVILTLQQQLDHANALIEIRMDSGRKSVVAAVKAPGSKLRLRLPGLCDEQTVVQLTTELELCLTRLMEVLHLAASADSLHATQAQQECDAIKREHAVSIEALKAEAEAHATACWLALL